MKRHFPLIIFLTLLLGTTTISCDKEMENEGNGKGKTSTANSNESHNNGRNCMTCHTAGGSGEGIFTVAGSVYDTNGGPYPHAVIKLYDRPGGQGNLILTLEVDQKGNFYTTQAINMGNGLYPCASNTATSQSMCMPSAVTTGACNSCHGNTVPKIYVK